jgi:hypothetical protein
LAARWGKGVHRDNISSGIINPMNFVLSVLGAVLLIASAVLCMRGRKSAALASIPAGLLFLFGNLDRVTDLKVSPSSLEAKLTQKISDADRIINQLKDFAVENAKLLIDVRENSHALIADNADVWAEADAYKASVLETLKRMGVSQNKIAEVDQLDGNLVLGFYEYAILRFGSDTSLCSGEQMRSAFNNDYKNFTPEQKQSADQWVKLLDKYHVDITQLSPYLRRRSKSQVPCDSIGETA